MSRGIVVRFVIDADRFRAALGKPDATRAAFRRAGRLAGPHRRFWLVVYDLRDFAARRRS